MTLLLQEEGLASSGFASVYTGNIASDNSTGCGDSVAQAGGGDMHLGLVVAWAVFQV